MFQCDGIYLTRAQRIKYHELSLLSLFATPCGLVTCAACKGSYHRISSPKSSSKSFLMLNVGYYVESLDIEQENQVKL